MIAKSAPGAECYSDHIPVISHLRLKLKKQKQAKTETKRNLALLKTNSARLLESAGILPFSCQECRDDDSPGWRQARPTAVGWAGGLGCAVTGQLIASAAANGQTCANFACF